MLSYKKIQIHMQQEIWKKRVKIKKVKQKYTQKIFKLFQNLNRILLVRIVMIGAPHVIGKDFFYLAKHSVLICSQKLIENKNPLILHITLKDSVSNSKKFVKMFLNFEIIKIFSFSLFVVWKISKVLFWLRK